MTFEPNLHKSSFFWVKLVVYTDSTSEIWTLIERKNLYLFAPPAELQMHGFVPRVYVSKFGHNYNMCKQTI